MVLTSRVEWLLRPETIAGNSKEVVERAINNKAATHPQAYQMKPVNKGEGVGLKPQAGGEQSAARPPAVATLRIFHTGRRSIGPGKIG